MKDFIKGLFIVGYFILGVWVFGRYFNDIGASILFFVITCIFVVCAKDITEQL